MQSTPLISRITIYPVKSLDGISLNKALVVKGGCLDHDREYAIRDENGRYIIGKTNALVYRLRSTVDFLQDTISFRHDDEKDWKTFHLQKERKDIDTWLSEYFGLTVHLHQNKEGRFLDIPDIGGVTVLSDASLETVSGWYNGMEIEETRRRFRATIEISGVPAFWEDQLFFEEGTAIEFKLGDCTILGMQPRARCVVPTHHPQTGELIHGFQKHFAGHRKSALPSWSSLDGYGHSYYLSTDCLIPSSETGKWIAVGDPLKIIGKKSL